jgi:hypothetical protein
MSNALVIKDHPNSRERISKRLKIALDAMIWPDESGRSLDYDEAARLAGIPVKSMRKSLERPVTRKYLQTGREVFRVALSTKILSRLGQLGMQDENRNAAVAACRTVLGQDEVQPRSLNAGSSPWLTIRIVSPSGAVSPQPMKVIEHEPELGSDPHDPCRELAPARFKDPTDPFR